MLASLKTWTTASRLLAVFGLIAVNVSVPLTANADFTGDCESCFICGGPIEYYECCGPTLPTIWGVDDCHDDDNECHLHGNPCPPGGK